MSTINLLPEDYLRRRARRRANAVCMVLFFLVMAGVLGAQMVSDASASHTKQILHRVKDDYAAAARLIDQMRQLEAQEIVLRKRAELTASLIERVPRSTLLGVITQALPEHSSLVSVHLQLERVVKLADPRGAQGTKFHKLAGQRARRSYAVIPVMEVTGLAGTDVEVGKFIANVARNPLIASADLVYSQEKLVGEVAAREFKVKLVIKPDADAIELRGRKEVAPPATPRIRMVPHEGRGT